MGPGAGVLVLVLGRGGEWGAGRGGRGGVRRLETGFDGERGLEMRDREGSYLGPQEGLCVSVTGLLGCPLLGGGGGH